MAPQFIYVMKALRKVVPPSRIILDDIWLSFYPGAKIGVLGPNGAGKSSLLRIMAGVDTEFQGEAWAHKGTRIGYLSQEPELDASLDVRGNVELAVKAQRDALNEFNAISLQFAEPDADFDKLMERQGKLQEYIDQHDLWNLDNKIDVAMDALRLPPGDAAVTHLSGGEKRRVALCKILLEEPDMLLLDEPTNHLDAESVAWLEHHLERFPGTVVAITHDRYFLDNVAKWILELDRGKGVPYEGNYSGWLEQKQQRLSQEEKQASARQKTLQKELEWVRMSPRARQAKNKARLQAYEDLASEAQNDRVMQNEIVIPPAPRLGNDVVRAKGLRKSFGDKLLFDNLNFDLPRAGIVGIIGPNGAGKTTLFRMINGLEQPESGELVVGETVQISYQDQHRTLEGKRTLWEEISGGRETIPVGKRELNSRAYAASFNFKGADQQKLVANLSGGERNRLHLAKTVMQGGNLLLLDEPTNDLDVDTLRALEEAVLDFSGCAVIISHDRWFLDRVATHILAFEGDSETVWFEGNYGAYIEDLKRRKGPDADQPHRIKYKKLVRN
ncbi:MAG TPA: energy-dependent translational throttle protein EttA [Gemmatimonas aurantiaca]|uniref:Energy-dependent translational throttle protein EttA n=2 Tax=Gemmatimonas aurantiaca TaxID=173480 RepID=C1ADP2_GEMAT|nr:energy-dependent translational throttle protein EttA [Gemmatimonas aurantiaca]BAH40619.1 putative ABC transporter ATP-binding protein [Gemmatimonas aurantiaca T-27]HCT56356.1 energy-dependent translational throttle protein EttA [Gemmatimonas aurantiaca]